MIRYYEPNSRHEFGLPDCAKIKTLSNFNFAMSLSRLITYLQGYQATYVNSEKKRNNPHMITRRIFFEDMIYGIGLAIDPDLFHFGEGFDRFRYLILDYCCNQLSIKTLSVFFRYTSSDYNVLLEEDKTIHT